jgi:hypothetical protein
MSTDKLNSNSTDQNTNTEGIKRDQHRVFLGKIDTALDKISTWGSGIATLAGIFIWLWTNAHWLLVFLFPFFAVLLFRRLKSPLKWQIGAGVIGVIGSVVATFILPHSDRETGSLTVAPNRIQIHDGNVAKENIVTVFNSNDFPVYGVIVKMETDAPFSRNPFSVRTEMRKSERLLSDDGDSVDFFSLFHRKSSRLFIVWINMPPKAYRSIRVSGTVATNSWASISVIGFDKEFAFTRASTNSTKWDVISTNSPIWKHLPGWVPNSFSIEIIDNPTTEAQKAPHLTLMLAP